MILIVLFGTARHECIVMGAERDISKGEQLLHTYGDLSDAQLLQTYGFVEAFQPGYENPHNFVPVPVHLVLQSCSESGDEVIVLCLCLASCSYTNKSCMRTRLKCSEI